MLIEKVSLKSVDGEDGLVVEWSIGDHNFSYATGFPIRADHTYWFVRGDVHGDKGGDVFKIEPSEVIAAHANGGHFSLEATRVVDPNGSEKVCLFITY